VLDQLATRFPVVIPPNFEPSDSEGDGVDLRADGRPCPCQKAPYKPAFGGGFKAMRGKHEHRALDIMAAEGAHVVSPCDGVVPEKVSIRFDGKPGPHPGAGQGIKAGHYVCVLGDLGQLWYMSHLRDAPLVKPGERVRAGQHLGFVGRTGNAVRVYRGPKGEQRRGCPHLHIALTVLSVPPGVIRELRKKGITVAGGKVDIVPLLKPLFEQGWC
jgi:murein DD-endopeptidase MepM/ murein hydrolase activator NlpD